MNKFRNILFLDIETVSQHASFDDLSDRFKQHWTKKAKTLRLDLSDEESYVQRAAIYSEFGKIISIGLGGWDNKLEKIKIGCIYSDDEKELLEKFKDILSSHPAGDRLILCAHNGKEFDFPYLCRRMLINQISLPAVLDISGKKPWEINHLDTLEMWKFGDYKNYTSLDLLATVFDIPGSKNMMDGSMVNDEYYLKKNLKGIAEYCRDDVEVLIQIFVRMSGRKSLDSDMFHYIDV